MFKNRTSVILAERKFTKSLTNYVMLKPSGPYHFPISTPELLYQSYPLLWLIFLTVTAQPTSKLMIYSSVIELPKDVAAIDIQGIVSSGCQNTEGKR